MRYEAFFVPVVYIRKVKKSESKSQLRIVRGLLCEGCVYP